MIYRGHEAIYPDIRPVLRGPQCVDVALLSRESLVEQKRQGIVFVGDLGFEVKEEVDRFLKTSLNLRN